MTGSLAATRSGSLFLAMFLAGPGVYFLVLAQRRFLRAVHPNSMVAYIALQVMFLGPANAGGLLFVWLLDEIGAGLILASGAVVAVLIARAFDGMHKRMDGVPTPWGIVLVSALIAVGLVADVRSRH